MRGRTHTLLALLLVGVVGVVAVSFPTRTQRGAVSLWTFTEGAGSTVHDVGGVGAPLDFSINGLGTSATWDAGTYGLTVDLRSLSSPGLVGASAAGFQKILDATQSPLCYNYTVEAWVFPLSTPVVNAKMTLLQFCDANMNPYLDSYDPPCISMQLTNASSSRQLRVQTFAAWANDPSSSLRSLAGGVSTDLTGAGAQSLLHVVSRYQTSQPSPPSRGLDQNGVSATEHIANGVLRGTNPDFGPAINGYGGTGSTLQDQHCWNRVAVGSQRATVGFNYDYSSGVQNGFHGHLFLLAFYNTSLTDAEVAANFAYGPPSTPPIASGATVATSESTPVDITFAASDVDTLYGFDVQLRAQLINISSSPYPPFGAAGYLNDTATGATLTPGAISDAAGASGPVLRFVPAFGVNGEVVIWYYAVDTRGVIGSANKVVVTVAADQNPPSAVNTSASVRADQQAGVVVNMTGVDLDPEDHLSVELLTLPPTTLGVLQLLNGSAAAVQTLYAPTAGLSWAQLRFVPASFLLPYLNQRAAVAAAFTFRVKDERAGATLSVNAATATVLITNNVVTPVLAATTAENVAVQLALSGTDLAGGTLSFQVAKLPSYGTLSSAGDPTALVVDADITGTVLVYTPNQYFYGVDTFQYRGVSSANAMVGPPTDAAVTVTFINQAPVALSQTVNMQEETGRAAVALGVWDVDLDAQATPPEFVFVASLPTNGAGSLAQALYPSNNTGATIAASGLPALVSSGGHVVVFQNSPVTSVQYALTSFTFYASDSYGLQGPAATVTVRIKNAVFAGDASYQLAQDTNTSFTLEAEARGYSGFTAVIMSLPHHGELCCNASGHPLTFVGMVVRPSLLVIFKPSQYFHGNDSFTFATQANGESTPATVSLRVTPVNVAPFIGLPVGPLCVLDTGALALANITVTDVDSPVVSVLVEVSFGFFFLADGSGAVRAIEWDAIAPAMASSQLLGLQYRVSNGTAVVADAMADVKVTVNDGQATTVATTSIDVVHINDTTPAAVVTVQGQATVENNRSAVIGVAVACAVFLIIAIIVFVLWWRGWWSTRKVKLPPPPDFMPFVFPPVDQAVASSAPAATLFDLEKLVLAPNLLFNFLLFETTSAAHAEEVACWCVTIWEARGVAMAQLKRLISHEMELATSGRDLFRSNSMTARLMKFYFKMIGIDYIYHTLGVDLLTIQRDQPSVEVDPNKVAEEDAIDLHVSRWTLLMMTQEFLTAVKDSSGIVPKQIVELCTHIYNEAKKKFPEQSYAAVGSIFLLRFVNPAITDPMSWGILKKPPQATTNRLLVLVAKTMQALATGTELQEEHMEELNTFIHANVQEMHEFFKKMTSASSNVDSAGLAPTPDHIRCALVGLHKLTRDVALKMDALIADSTESDALMVRTALNSIYHHTQRDVQLL